MPLHTKQTMRTRQMHRTPSVYPPPLCRTSAMRRIRFTVVGRRLARRLVIPDHEEYMYYFTTVDGVTTHHFLSSSTHNVWSLPAYLLPEMDACKIK